MAIDWQQVGVEVTNVVVMVLGNSWQLVSNAAGPQIQAMIIVGQSIEQSNNSGMLTELEYNSLRSMQKNALEGILSSYEAVGIVVAEQAAQAAWNVISQALVTAGVGFA
jgi:hypothetical protein